MVKNPIAQFVFRTIVVDIALVVLSIFFNFITPLHATAGFLLQVVLFSPIVIILGALLLAANQKKFRK